MAKKATPKQKKTKTFVVAVCRTSYAFKDIEVTASNKKEAKRLGLEHAGDYEFSEKDADYTSNGVTEVKS